MKSELMFGTNSNHGGKDGYLHPVTSTIDELTYSFNTEASHQERANKSFADSNNTNKNVDRFLESFVKHGTSNLSKGDLEKDQHQLGFIYRHIYNTVNNALNLTNTDDELNFASNNAWDESKLEGSKPSSKRRGRVHSTVVQRQDTIEYLTKGYRNKRKTEIDDNSIFFTSIMRELRRQSKDNFTSIIEKKLMDQAQGLNMNLTCVVPSRQRVISAKPTRPKNSSVSKDRSLNESPVIQPRPLHRRDGKRESTKMSSNEKIGRSGNNIIRIRPQSEGRCFFPDSFFEGSQEVKENKQQIEAVSRKQRFNNSKKNDDSHLAKLPKEYNSLEPIDDGKEAKICLNKSPSLRGFNAEEDHTPLRIGEKKTTKFSDTVPKSIKDKLNQTHQFAKHDAHNSPLSKSKTSSPLKIDMTFDKQRQIEFLRQEKEKFRRERIQRNQEFKRLTKSRIMTDFERISKKLKSYQEMRDKNDKQMETLKKY